MESFDSKQLEAFKSHMTSYMKERVSKGIYSAALRLVEIIQSEIIPGIDPQPVDRGMYRAGWQAAKTQEGADVFNDVPHAPIIEYGVKAANVKVGRKMIDALTEWVIRKGFVAKQGRTLSGKRRSKASHEVRDEARQIAWAIAKNMEKQGIFNKGDGLRVLEKAHARIPELLQREVARELNG